MSSKPTNFAMPEFQHFSDYGFDPQNDYFRLMEEARKHKRKTSTTKSVVNSLHSKLQKTISKEGSSWRKNKSVKTKKKLWWKNALSFLNWKKWVPVTGPQYINKNIAVFADEEEEEEIGVHKAKARAFGPVYMTESMSGSTTSYRTSRPPPLTPAGKAHLEMPYLSLRDLINKEGQHRNSASTTPPPMPIYLVT